MTEVKIDIPKKIIDEAAKQQIVKLEKELKNALERERKLKVKVSIYKEAEQRENRIRQKLNDFVWDIADDLGVHDQCEGCW